MAGISAVLFHSDPVDYIHDDCLVLFYLQFPYKIKQSARMKKKNLTCATKCTKSAAPGWMMSSSSGWCTETKLPTGCWQWMIRSLGCPPVHETSVLWDISHKNWGKVPPCCPPGCPDVRRSALEQPVASLAPSGALEDELSTRADHVETTDTKTVAEATKTPTGSLDQTITRSELSTVLINNNNQRRQHLPAYLNSLY